MDKKEHSYNFDDIRPLNDNEVEQAIETLVSSEGLQRALRFIKPELDWEAFVAAMRSCKTKAQFKSAIGSTQYLFIDHLGTEPVGSTNSVHLYLQSPRHRTRRSLPQWITLRNRI